MALTKSYQAVRLSVCMGSATFCPYLSIGLASVMIVLWFTHHYYRYKYLRIDRSMIRQKITILGLIHVPDRPNPQVLLCQSLMAGELRYPHHSSIVETQPCRSGMLFMPDIPYLIMAMAFGYAHRRFFIDRRIIGQR